jgi:hypothetical protein
MKNKNEEEQEKEFDNMIESILKDIEKEEFEEKKNALFKIKSDVEEKMKNAKNTSERQMILMNMQTNNMEELTGYAKQIKKEQDAFYEKHAEVIKNLRQKRIEKEALDIISQGMKEIEEDTFNSIARAESPGISKMFKDLEIEQQEKKQALEVPSNVFDMDIGNNGGKKKKTKQRKVKRSKRKTKKRKTKN